MKTLLYTQVKATLFLTMLVAFTGCKKDGDNKDTKPLRVKTVSNGGITTTYTYDEQFRLLKAEPDQGFFREEYLYEPGKITWTKTEPSNSYTLYYHTGSNGYLQSKQWAGSNDTEYYEYNGSGSILRVSNNKTPGSETVYYYNTATGLKDSTRTTTGGVWNSTSVFLYDTDKTSTINSENFGLTFWGKEPEHPVKSVAIRRPDGNIITVSVTSYIYTYDNEGRITGRSFTTSGGQSGSETYTYY